MEEAAVKLSVLCSLAGLVLLYFFSTHFEATQTRIADIIIEDVGSTFMVCGNLTSTRVSNGHVFLSMADGSGSIRLVFFNSTVQSAKARGFDIYELPASLCLEAQVDEYPKGSGTLELVYRDGRIRA
jgi:aspartyl/asparaginyl-tRNA synthetase